MILMLIVTAIACFVAMIASLVAWRVVREEQRRSDARVAALAADIHGTTPGEQADLMRAEPPPVAIDRLFATTSPETDVQRPRFAAIIGGGALVVGSFAVLLVLLTSGARPSASVATHPQTAANAAAAPAEAAPLELVALGHE